MRRELLHMSELTAKSRYQVQTLRPSKLTYFTQSIVVWRKYICTLISTDCPDGCSCFVQIVGNDWFLVWILPWGLSLLSLRALPVSVWVPVGFPPRFTNKECRWNPGNGKYIMENYKNMYQQIESKCRRNLDFKDESWHWFSQSWMNTWESTTCGTESHNEQTTTPLVLFHCCYDWENWIT